MKITLYIRELTTGRKVKSYGLFVQINDEKPMWTTWISQDDYNYFKQKGIQEI